MFATLRVREIGAIVLVDCEAESTFKGADVVFEEVGVFVEVDGFKGEFAQTLATVGVSCGVGCDTTATKFGASTILVVHSGGLGGVEKL